jgi:hypothetical protein
MSHLAAHYCWGCLIDEGHSDHQILQSLQKRVTCDLRLWYLASWITCGNDAGFSLTPLPAFIHSDLAKLGSEIGLRRSHKLFHGFGQGILALNWSVLYPFINDLYLKLTLVLE